MATSSNRQHPRPKPSRDTNGNRQSQNPQKQEPATATGVQHLTVSSAEAGQKLLQFLQRRLGKEVPQGFLMRIIRKGEVRLNKGRVKPYDRVEEGDIVRVPPMRDVKPQKTTSAGNIAEGLADAKGNTGKETDTSCTAACGMVVARAEGLLVFNKPAGLPVQPGTGHTDCVTTRLAHCFASADFMPAPAHRLDKNTSGLLLIGTTYARLRQLQDLFRNGHAIGKEYCAWVEGDWPYKDTQQLHDELIKDREIAKGGREKVRTITPDTAHSAKIDANKKHVISLHTEARDASMVEEQSPQFSEKAKVRNAHCAVTPLIRRNGYTLMHIALFTGRTHQIRVQLSSRGYPVAGDIKYGASPCSEGMLLHAFRIKLPDESFTCLPSWQGKWAVEIADLPE